MGRGLSLSILEPSGKPSIKSDRFYLSDSTNLSFTPVSCQSLSQVVSPLTNMQATRIAQPEVAATEARTKRIPSKVSAIYSHDNYTPQVTTKLATCCTHDCVICAYRGHWLTSKSRPRPSRSLLSCGMETNKHLGGELSWSAKPIPTTLMLWRRRKSWNQVTL